VLKLYLVGDTCLNAGLGEDSLTFERRFAEPAKKMSLTIEFK